MSGNPSIDLRIEIQEHTVDEATTVKFLQEHIMSKFAFIESVVPLVNDGFARLMPEEKMRLTRAQRPVTAHSYDPVADVEAFQRAVDEGEEG